MKKIIMTSIACIWALTVSLHAELAAVSNSLQFIECKVTPLSLMSKSLKRKYRYRSEGSDGQGIATHIPIFQGTSLNWSGYAALTNLISPAVNVVTNVSGSWTVPSLSPTANTTYSSIWVGMDGYSNGTVEQIGTEQDWSNGKQQNYAWFEMYPQSAYEIVGFPVNKRDRMGAEVKYVGNGTFKLTITNYTKNVYTVIPSSYTKSKTAQRSSAEWVIEAPSSTNGVLPLANFGTVAFTNCYATINGVTGPINSPRWRYDAITMKTANNLVKSLPSGLTANGTAFTATWNHQ